MMNRRRWLKNTAAAAVGYALRRFPAAGSSVASKSEYFPRYVDVGKEAGLLAKTIIAGHENKDFLLSTTAGA